MCYAILINIPYIHIQIYNYNSQQIILNYIWLSNRTRIKKRKEKKGKKRKMRKYISNER